MKKLISAVLAVAVAGALVAGIKSYQKCGCEEPAGTAVQVAGAK